MIPYVEDRRRKAAIPACGHAQADEALALGTVMRTQKPGLLALLMVTLSCATASQSVTKIVDERVPAAPSISITKVSAAEFDVRVARPATCVRREVVETHRDLDGCLSALAGDNCIERHAREIESHPCDDPAAV